MNWLCCCRYGQYLSLESTLYQKYVSLIKANIIVPSKFKCRPPLCKWHAEMFLCKMILSTSFLPVWTIDRDMTMFLKSGWNFFVISSTFIKFLYIKSSGFFWTVPGTDMDDDTIWIKRSVFAPGKSRTLMLLLLESLLLSI